MAANSHTASFSSCLTLLFNLRSESVKTHSLAKHFSGQPGIQAIYMKTNALLDKAE